MLWSPIVKDSRGQPEYNQVLHLAEIKAHIRTAYDVELECIFNERFLACLDELRTFARLQTSELQCPLLRLLQIEELLGAHVKRIAANKALQPTQPPSEAERLNTRGGTGAAGVSG